MKMKTLQNCGLKTTDQIAKIIIVETTGPTATRY